MASTSTQAGSTERILVTTENGGTLGQGKIRSTSSETSITLELRFPARSCDLDQVKGDDSSNGASNYPSSNAEAAQSASTPLSEPAVDSSNTADVDPSISSNPDSDETNKSTDSETSAKKNGSLSTPESDPETQEAGEAKSDTSSEDASSEEQTQNALLEASDTTSSPTSSSGPSDAETTDSSSIGTETEESSPGSDESTDTVNNEYIPTSTQNQEALESWINARQQEQAQTPDKPIRQIELVSWLQVPEILRALSNNEGPLRITYPDCENQSITAEQQAIREFLVQGAGRDLTDLIGELKEKISACHFVESGIVTADLAEQYRSSIPVESSSSTKLTVAEVIRTNEHFIPNNGNKKARMTTTAKNGRELILKAITSTMQASTEFHTFIIEVPEEHRDVAKLAFADYYKKLDEEQKPDAQYTKVWVLPSRNSTKDIEELDFLDFIKDPPNMSPRKRTISSGTRSISRPQLVGQQLGNTSN
jgi:hypothetical protein